MNLKHQPTIYAPISGIGGAISVIRVSGSNTRSLSKILTNFENPQKNRAFLSNIIDPSTKDFLDSVLITFFEAPNSFTGEDVAEISVHASEYIIKELLRILSEGCHFQLAKNGEFTQRAFLNGKLDLIEAEGINDLIRSQTKMQHRLASELFIGNASKKYKSWNIQIKEIIALFEASIDFSEEDLPPDILKSVEEKINQLKKDFEYHIKMQKSYENIRSGIKIPIIGIPNVGKSSLINALSQKDIAIVTPISGTTRDAIESLISIDGFLASIVDTAGIRETSDVIEKEGIRRSLLHKNTSEFGIVVIDLLQNPEFQAESLSGNIVEDDIIILNKKDKLNKEGQIKIYSSISSKFPRNKILLSSMLSRSSIDEIRLILAEKIKSTHTIGSSPAIINERHLLCIKQCAETLDRLTLNDYSEIICEELRHTAFLLGEVIGTISSEEILDIIFGKFCIGK